MEEFRSSLTFLLICCCLATFSDVIVATVLPPILPFVLPKRANVPADQVQQWVSILPAIAGGTIVISTPFAGYFSDRHRRRKPLFITAIVIQSIGVGLLMIGDDIALWIIGQVSTGVSSAMVWSTTLAYIVNAVPRTQMARFLGLTSLSLSLAVFLGPVLGGIVYKHGGFYAVWGMVYGVLGLDITLRLLLVESNRVLTVPDVDTVEGSRTETVRSRSAALLLLKSPRMLSALWAAFAQAAILASFDATLTIHVQHTFGWSSETAGLLYIAFVLPSFASPLVGSWADRFGGRKFGGGGFLASSAVLVCLRFVDNASISDMILLCALLALLGLFLTTTIPIFCAEVGHIVFEMECRRPGIFGQNGTPAKAQGMWWAAYTLGVTVGPLWGGFVQKRAGWATMAWSLAILSGLTAITTVVSTKSVLGNTSCFEEEGRNPEAKTRSASTP